MSEDEERSNSSIESRSSRSIALDRDTSNVDNSGDESATDADGSDKDGSQSDCTTDNEEEDLDGDDTRGDSGSCSDSSAANSGSEDDEGDRSDSSRSRGSQSASGSRSSRSRSASEQSDNQSHDDVDIKKLWQTDPDFYGVRRSSRQKEASDSKPPKLHPQVKSSSAKVSSKQSSRKRRLSSSDDSSDDEEVARTVRKRAAQTINYKEDDSEEDEVSDENELGDQQLNGKQDEPEEQVETIERIMDHRIGQRGATGSGTTVYAVEERGDPNILLAGSSEKESQFLIKWTGWSHLHNTWESLETLQETKAKGLKKLDNFCRREDEISRWKAKANPEDIEYYECQLELQQELTKAYINAERIIAEHKGSDGLPEFYVKWECLPYADATWEQGALTQKRYPRVIEEFKKRDASTRTPSGSAKSLRSRPKFVQIKSQPSYMASDCPNLELRDYQLDGVNWLVHSWCKDNSVILADEMGLGKTIQTICFLSYLFEAQGLHGPYLIVVPLSTMAAWQREFAQWAPQINVVTYLGDVSSRDIIREYEWFFKSNRKIKFNAILTTYEIVLKDKAFLSSLSWAILMVDEAHRLKNGDSLLYKTLSDFDTSHRLLITGTPLQNSLKELWSLLHFIMPNKFDDWESFEKEHDNAATKGYSKLHKQLEPFIIRRVKKDVEKSLPAKVEQILRVEMTSLQKQYYKWILTKNYSALRKGLKGSVSSFVNVVMELKKCCNHAQLVKPLENPGGDSLSALIKGSGKLMLLDKLLVRLKETGHRVLIFSQMVRMLDIIAEYLQSRRFAFQRLDGSIKGDLRKQALDHFNSEGSNDFCFLLSTRAGGLGINLATADTVIIFDSDWNPQNDLQAQARAHRIGQKNQVNIYRLVTKNSVEEDIVERAKRKMVLDHLVIQRMDTTGRTVLDKGNKAGTPFNKDELTAILKFGAEELFKEDENDGDDNCDIDEILRRAETHEEPGERPGDELLSAFKVASFAVNEDEDIETLATSYEGKDWEQIIPEGLRKKIEDEEKEKEMADLFLPPRSSRAAHREQEGSKESGNSIGKKVRKKRKRDESEESGSDAEGRPRKRGRPRMYGRVSVKGFNDNQIRRFIRSFKRFPKPLLRIDAIARDADLSEKSLSDLKKLGESLYQKCMHSIAEAKANPTLPVKEESLPVPDDVAGAAGSVSNQTGVKKKQKPREKGPIFKLSGVAVNARTLSNALDELEPLGEAIPKDEMARKEWKFEFRAKATSYDVEWGPEEDTRLLLGVWEHGMGAWQTICDADPILKEKVFVEGDKKPQLKHIQTRAEYLMRVLKKNSLLNSKSLTTKIRKKRVEKKKEAEEEKIGNLAVPNTGLATSGDGVTGESSKDNLEPNLVKGKSKRGRKKKDVGPMHFTTGAEPTPLNVLGDLDPVVFNECKEKMRPVKKALKALDKFDPALSEKEQIRHTRNCLMQIGDQIQACLADITDPAQLKQSKTNLWYFVSKFTEYDPTKLYKLYKKSSKKEKKDGKSSKSSDKVDKSKSDKDRDKSGSKEKHHREKKERGVDRKDSQRVRDKVRSNERPRSAEIRERAVKASLPNEFRERERGAEPRDRIYQREWDRSHDRPVGDPRDRDFDRSPGDSRDRSMADPRERAPVDSRESYRGTGDPRERDRLSGDPRERDRSSGDPRERDRSSGDPRERDRSSGDPRERDRLLGDQRERDRERDRLSGDQRDYERSPASYNRHHGFDRDRGERGWNDRSPRGRPWGQPKSRWNPPPAAASHYGGPPRRDADTVSPITRRRKPVVTTRVIRIPYSVNTPLSDQQILNFITLGSGRAGSVPRIAVQKLAGITAPPRSSLRLNELYSELEDEVSGSCLVPFRRSVTPIRGTTPLRSASPIRALSPGPIRSITYHRNSAEDSTQSHLATLQELQSQSIMRSRTDDVLLHLALGLHPPLYSLHHIPLRSALDVKEACDVRRQFVHERNMHDPLSRAQSEIYRMAFNRRPRRVDGGYIAGNGTLSCLSYAGGRPIAKRRRFYHEEEPSKVDDLKFNNYYKPSAVGSYYSTAGKKPSYQPIYRSKKSLLGSPETPECYRNQVSRWESKVTGDRRLSTPPRRISPPRRVISTSTESKRPEKLPSDNIIVTLPSPRKSVSELPEDFVPPSTPTQQLPVPEESVVFKIPRKSVSQEPPELSKKEEEEEVTEVIKIKRPSIKPTPSPEPEAEVEPANEPEVVVNAEPEPTESASVIETEPEVKDSAEPEQEPEIPAEVAAEPVVEPEEESKPAEEPEPQVEPEAESVADTEAEVDAAPETSEPVEEVPQEDAVANEETSSDPVVEDQSAEAEIPSVQEVEEKSEVDNVQETPDQSNAEPADAAEVATEDVPAEDETAAPAEPAQEADDSVQPEEETPAESQNEEKTTSVEQDETEDKVETEADDASRADDLPFDDDD